jgi:hypothetical protein
MGCLVADLEGAGQGLAGYADRFPALIAAIGDGAFGPKEGAGFEFGLERILDGIETHVNSVGPDK